MRVSVILAHPDPKSFNAAIARTVLTALKKKGATVFYHDLYREKFSPVLPAAETQKNAKLPRSIQKYCNEISRSEGLILIHPNWWGQPPAILKGWIDRVLRPGVAYEFLETDSGEGVPRGLLKIKQVLILNTSNTPKAREEKVFEDPLRLLWKNCILDLCGVKRIRRKIFRVVVTSTLKERKKWLKEAGNLVHRLF